jgi:hypothetical protein
MKKLVSLALTVATAAIVPSAAQAAEVSHSQTSGSYASVQTFDGNGYAYLYVTEGGSPGNETVYLQFYASSCTYSGMSYNCTGTTAWGQLPKGDFAVHGNARGADLAVDASSLTGSTYSYGCDWTTWTCTVQDGPRPAGTIDVSWDQNGEYSYTSNGRTDQDFLNYTFTTIGRSSYASAAVSGQILGTPVASQFGQIGTNSSMTHSIVRNY